MANVVENLPKATKSIIQREHFENRTKKSSSFFIINFKFFFVWIKHLDMSFIVVSHISCIVVSINISFYDGKGESHYEVNRG